MYILLLSGACFILFSSFQCISLVSNLIDFRLHINFVDQMLFGGGAFIGIVAAVALLGCGNLFLSMSQYRLAAYPIKIKS